jgi:AsmA-like C-terminal region
MSRRRRTFLFALVTGGILVALLLSLASRATPHVRDQVVAAMNERFESEVALEALQVSVFPRPEVTGRGLSVRWDGRDDVPPLVRLGTFRASAGLLGLLGTPVRLHTVELDRLELFIPPGGLHGAAGSQPARPAGHLPARLTIDEIVSRAAELHIASKDPAKLPRVFEIHDLHILGFGQHDGADFRASLTNPTPRGRIETTGRFGPWEPREPRKTPIRGEYTFSKADMNTIKGLGGTLSSRGSYGGILERIEVSGETDTPDFSIDLARRPVPLKTRFKAVVDGTNGNTFLEQVDATLLESHIHATGAVVRTKDVKGREVALDIRIDNARIEDLLKLAVAAPEPPLTGAVKVKTKFLLPAGEADVVGRLRLDGEFALDRARFTNLDVQKRINELSQRARGDDSPSEGPSVVSQLGGRFALEDRTLTFSTLTFSVQGARVELKGTYGLRSEALDFTGNLLLDASLRETTSGVKAIIGAVAQPLFRRKGGGTKIPIRIGGTRSKPEFGVDVKRALGPG